MVKSDYQRREEKKVKKKKKLISETPYQSCDILCEPHCRRESESEERLVGIKADAWTFVFAVGRQTG